MIVSELKNHQLLCCKETLYTNIDKDKIIFIKNKLYPIEILGFKYQNDVIRIRTELIGIGA